MIPDKPDAPHLRRHEDLREAFARFEGSVTAILANLGSDLKSLAARIASFPTQRDLKALESSTKNDLETLRDRVTKLESNQAWIARLVIGTVVSLLLGGLGFAMKLLARM